MKKPVRVIRIDPVRCAVEEITMNPDSLPELYAQIDCQTIDVVCRQPNGDALIVDDEALLTEPQPPAFKFGGYAGVIHGVALMTGCDRNGNSTAPRATLEQVRQQVTFLGNIHTEPEIFFIPLG